MTAGLHALTWAKTSSRDGLGAAAGNHGSNKGEEDGELHDDVVNVFLELKFEKYCVSDAFCEVDLCIDLIFGIDGEQPIVAEVSHLLIATQPRHRASMIH
jgi:hypothetical protein